MRRHLGLVAMVLLVVCSGQLRAQTTRMPGTLRYGSGLLDVPAASVLPRLAITATYSGFSVDVASRPSVGPAGTVTGSGDRWSRWLSDAAVAVGLGGGAEVGASFQSFSAPEEGGSMVGAFGRYLLLDPERHDGLGLAVGARYLSSPGFEGEIGGGEPRPGRLGFPDRRLRDRYASEAEGVSTNLSPYVVASALLPGFDLRFVPEHDLTFVFGRGGGMFSGGGDLPWYAVASSDGWFFGSAAHFELRDHLLLNLVGEFNGFDVNLGAELDVGGVQVGGFVLGANYGSGASAYRSRKWGVSATVALCPTRGGLCRSELRERDLPDTIQLPAPPPDTVVIEGRPPADAGGSRRPSGGGAPLSRSDVLLHDPVRGVERRDGGTSPGAVVGTGIRADEMVFGLRRAAPDAYDHHPRVEDPHRLGAHQFELQVFAGGLLDGRESGGSRRPRLAFPRLGPFDPGLEEPVLRPFEPDANFAPSIGKALLLEDGEAQP